MTKVTLDIDAFKALASDTRLEILKTLDGKHMNLSEISRVTQLNKATLHEHLTKLQQAGLIKRKERTGHKWVYYKLSWKGECLLHPDNTRIVVMFSTAFFTLALAFIQMYNYVKGSILHSFDTFNEVSPLVDDSIARGGGVYGNNSTVWDYVLSNTNNSGNFSIPPEFLEKSTNITGAAEDMQTLTTTASEFYHNPIFLYIAIACIVLFCIIFSFSVWRYKLNKKQSV